MKPTAKPFLVALQNAVAKAWQGKDIRMWRRLKAVSLFLRGESPESICTGLHVSRRSIFYCMRDYDRLGIAGLREGQHPGRPVGLNSQELERLAEILDSGTVAYGFSSGIWTCARVGHVIPKKFASSYHDDHVRKILHRLGFSVQRPTKKLARANPQWQRT